jgi:hypothetical protein
MEWKVVVLIFVVRPPRRGGWEVGLCGSKRRWMVAIVVVGLDVEDGEGRTIALVCKAETVIWPSLPLNTPFFSDFVLERV